MLSAERWQHIMTGIPSWRRTRRMFCAIEAPTEALPGREADEEWFYLRDAGPSRWLKVVVLFDTSVDGRIITAFPRRRKP